MFFFSFGLRLWGLNDMGRTWDESPYVDDGYRFIELAKEGDLRNSKWYENFDHPPLGRYMYGLAEHLDNVKTANGQTEFPYDYTYPRVVAALLSAFSVVLIALIGWEFISPNVGTYSAIIFSMLPFFMGFAKTATLEAPIMFFFTASVYSFLKFLTKFTTKMAILTGIFTGLALLTKQTNLLLIPLYFIIQVFWYLFDNTKFNKINFRSIIFFWAIISFTAIITVFLLWPMPWFHFKEVMDYHNKMWITNTSLPPPEVFFGKLILVPKYYYVVMFLITTPFLILLLSLFGLLEITRQKKKIFYVILIWFLFPFIQSFYSFKQHGIRYIIEIYAPFALLAGLGFEHLSNRLNLTKQKQALLFVPIFLYMAIQIISVHPYYLNYYNELVGGASGVYKSKQFQLGWWKEGVKEATLYIDARAQKNSAVAFVPNQFPDGLKTKNLILQKYQWGREYNFVVLNYFSVLREGFDATEIYQNYKKIHSVTAGDAPIVDIFKHK